MLLCNQSAPESIQPVQAHAKPACLQASLAPHHCQQLQHPMAAALQHRQPTRTVDIHIAAATSYWLPATGKV